MSVSVGVNKKCSLDELVRVAQECQSVGIIGTDVLGLKQAMITTDASSILRTNDGNECVSRVTSRAGLFCLINALVQGRPGHAAKLLEFLLTALNCNVVPAFTCNNKASDELIAFIGGNGMCYSGNKHELIDASMGLSNAGLTAVSVTPEQASELKSYPFLVIGTGCLAAAAAGNYIRMVDCVAALSCEASGCNVDAFDAANFEVCRPHRGQMQSASNLRLLLDGSKRTNTCSKEASVLVKSLQTSPQTIGPCRDIIVAAFKSMEIELNCYDNGGRFDASQALLITQNLLNALDILARSSEERTTAVSVAAGVEAEKCSAAASSNSPSTVVDARSVERLIERLTMSLSAEVATANKTLCELEAREAAISLAKMELAEKNKAAADAEGNKGGNRGKPEAADDSNMTPEQRARAEAKRREKAEKAAQKAAAKEQKKASGGAAVSLGAGSTLVRGFIQTTAQQSPQGAVTVTFMSTLLAPYDLREGGFAAYCTKVLEQLNSGGKFKPKIAKGARDFGPEQMRIREQAFTAIRRVFKRHGGVEIDTPVFELKELLTGKYGEDSKLIYDLADQGGELLSLRYDLTVPFARFLAMRSVGNIKRYHIAKVYRRDQPQAARGRYREFYQCDFDIAGSFSPMVPDAEVITVATEILSELPIGQFSIKLNHRKLLDAIFEISGVPADKFRPICSAVDKLDKMSWEEVKKEMVEEKGLASEAADRIADFVLHSGSPKELWAKFTETKLFGDHPEANAAMAELKLLFDYLDAMGSLQYVSFDMSLARGLDYYTGVIYEAVLINGAVAVGSIAAGGRYDNLVGMFSPAGVQTPCVGVSIGVERVFAIMEKKAEELNIMQTSGIQVYVASIGANLIAERMKVAQLLWRADISAEYPHQDNPKFKKQLDEALERGIPYMVVFGSEELAKGVVKVKDMRLHTEVEVARDSLVAVLQQQGCGAAGVEMDFLTALKASASSSTVLEPDTA